MKVFTVSLNFRVPTSAWVKSLSLAFKTLNLSEERKGEFGYLSEIHFEFHKNILFLNQQ